MTGSIEKIGGGGLHHVAMRVGNFNKTIQFYTEGLGFKKAMAWGEGNSRAAMLDTGDGNFLEVFAGGSSELKPEGAFIHLAFRTESCDKAIEAARTAGARITVEPKDVDIQSDPVTKVRIGFCTGPDGEVLEFFQYR